MGMLTCPNMVAGMANAINANKVRTVRIGSLFVNRALMARLRTTNPSCEGLNGDALHVIVKAPIVEKASLCTNAHPSHILRPNS